MTFSPCKICLFVKYIYIEGGEEIENRVRLGKLESVFRSYNIKQRNIEREKF